MLQRLQRVQRHVGAAPDHGDLVFGRLGPGADRPTDARLRLPGEVVHAFAREISQGVEGSEPLFTAMLEETRQDVLVHAGIVVQSEDEVEPGLKGQFEPFLEVSCRTQVRGGVVITDAGPSTFVDGPLYRAGALRIDDEDMIGRPMLRHDTLDQTEHGGVIPKRRYGDRDLTHHGHSHFRPSFASSGAKARSPSQNLMQHENFPIEIGSFLFIILTSAVDSRDRIPLMDWS